MKFAEECNNVDIFTQISTTFAISDKKGFIDEKHDPEVHHDWNQEY